MALAILVAIAGLVFHVRNDVAVTVDYIVGHVAVDLSWLVVACLVIGAICGVLAVSTNLLQLKRENRRLRKAAEQSSREASALRAVAAKNAG